MHQELSQMIIAVMEKGSNTMTNEIQQHLDNLKELNKRRLEMEKQMISYIAFLEGENAGLKETVKNLTEKIKELLKDSCE